MFNAEPVWHGPSEELTEEGLGRAARRTPGAVQGVRESSRSGPVYGGTAASGIGVERVLREWIESQFS